MRINADFSARVVVASQQHTWVASPQGGVERVMLDRVGGEKARATSLVRYQGDSSFPAHQHPGGEEVLVLSGTFSEEDAHYPAGWYLRNPPGSSHRTASGPGAIIFVKLWQMPLDERLPVRIDTRDPAAWQRQGTLQVCPLFHSQAEQVRLCRLAPGSTFDLDAVQGAEVLLLDGVLSVEGTEFAPGSWWRRPPGDAMDLTAGARGATIYLKTGHLAHVLGPACSR